MVFEVDYAPLGGDVLASAGVALLPILSLFALLFVTRVLYAALAALAGTLLVATLLFGMPPAAALLAALHGALFGAWPVCLIVSAAIFLYDACVVTGHFDVVKYTLVSLTRDKRALALALAYCFSGVIEGGSGFSTPIALAGAMMVGVGFEPLEAAAAALVGNTVAVVSGGVGIPTLTLASTTGIDAMVLTVAIQRLMLPFSFLLPWVVVFAVSGESGVEERPDGSRISVAAASSPTSFPSSPSSPSSRPSVLSGLLLRLRRTAAVWPACLLVSVVQPGVAMVVAIYVGPSTVSVASFLCALVALAVLLRYSGWRPPTTLMTRAMADEEVGHANVVVGAGDEGGSGRAAADGGSGAGDGKGDGVTAGGASVPRAGPACSDPSPALSARGQQQQGGEGGGGTALAERASGPAAQAAAAPGSARPRARTFSSSFVVERRAAAEVAYVRGGATGPLEPTASPAASDSPTASSSSPSALPLPADNSRPPAPPPVVSVVVEGDAGPSSATAAAATSQATVAPAPPTTSARRRRAASATQHEMWTVTSTTTTAPSHSQAEPSSSRGTRDGKGRSSRSAAAGPVTVVPAVEEEEGGEAAEGLVPAPTFVQPPPFSQPPRPLVGAPSSRTITICAPPSAVAAANAAIANDAAAASSGMPVASSHVRLFLMRRPPALTAHHRSLLDGTSAATALFSHRIPHHFRHTPAPTGATTDGAHVLPWWRRARLRNVGRRAASLTERTPPQSGSSTSAAPSPSPAPAAVSSSATTAGPMVVDAAENGPAALVPAERSAAAAGDSHADSHAKEAAGLQAEVHVHYDALHPPTRREVALAWLPWLSLAVAVTVWGSPAVKAGLGAATVPVKIAGLHNMVSKPDPLAWSSQHSGGGGGGGAAAAAAAPHTVPAVWTLDLLGAAGVCVYLVALCTLFGAYGVGPRKALRIFLASFRRMALSFLTICVLMAFGYVLKASGQDVTLGLAAAKSAGGYPFVGTCIGFLGVALTGSATSTSVIFGSLQVVAAQQLGLNPVLMASANMVGGCMGHVVSTSSMVVAGVATGLPSKSIGPVIAAVGGYALLLVAVAGAWTTVVAFAAPGFIPTA